MEAELLTKILASSGGVTAILYFLNWRVNKFEQEVKNTADRVEVFHREGLEKVEKLIETQNKLITQISLHAQKFDHGEERMASMEKALTEFKEWTYGALDKTSANYHRLTDKIQILLLKEKVEKREL